MNVLGAFLIVAQVWAGTEVPVAAGKYAPFFRDADEKDQSVGPLLVDRYPVTNAEFKEFVAKHPEWAPHKVKPLFAAAGYLEHWDKALPDRPVTNISWFAARKYCASLGKRLMTVAEWEYASDAQDPANLERVLAWYGKTGGLASVKSSPANRFGIHGMHGLIWEWVEDFSSAILSGDSRSTNDTSREMFCGSGSLRAKDPAQYATFMRYAHRSSLTAKSVGRNLGFRCVKDAPLK